LLAHAFAGSNPAPPNFFPSFPHLPLTPLSVLSRIGYQSLMANSFFPYEHHRQPVASHPVFFRRVLLHFVMAVGVLGMTMGIGIIGYTQIGGLAWDQSVLESAMLMGGMGPVYGDKMTTTPAKLFSAGYALFCGLVLIALFGIILAPVFHRILHRLHVPEK
ncbi:MAG: hypothetical protein EBZ78_10080, partial [Verrucomicrobia bacterium]|nr:hypothetical protein [Verrucomicrobiota bacterium]